MTAQWLSVRPPPRLPFENRVNDRSLQNVSRALQRNGIAA